MKALAPNYNPQSKQSLQLFSKLKALKQKEEPIQGIPLVQSDSEEDHQQNIDFIERQLESFKHMKAKEVAELHNSTQQSIEGIVQRIKDELKLQALSIINPAFKDSVQRRQKPVKDMGSTLPGSTNKQSPKQTPGFDLPSSKSKSKQLTIDLRQFTLGQRQHNSSSNRPLSNRQQQYVSEFTIPNRQPSSRRIKDRIMNSHKNNK